MSDSGTPIDETGAFPGPGDTLFPGAPAACTAASSQSSGQAWYDYTTGYKEAADLLVAHSEATGRRADKLGYPILFLYRQHLELVVRAALEMPVDAIYLLTGDGDYLPLAREITRRTSKQVYLGAFSSGLADGLQSSAEFFVDLDRKFFR